MRDSYTAQQLLAIQIKVLHAYDFDAPIKCYGLVVSFQTHENLSIKPLFLNYSMQTQLSAHQISFSVLSQLVIKIRNSISFRG